MDNKLKIANFNIMSDKHSDYFFWKELKDLEGEYDFGKSQGYRGGKGEAMKQRYEEVINVIKEVNNDKKLDILAFQEVTKNSVKNIEDYCKNNDYIIKETNIESVNKPIKLVTIFKKSKFEEEQIEDLTPNYQTFYHKNGYNTKKDIYYSGRAQVFKIKHLNLILINVHAPGNPDGPTQKNYYKGLTSFIRCNCISNQISNCNINTNPNIIFIGDFNLPDTDKIRDWSNDNGQKFKLDPEFTLYEDKKKRNTSYHSGIEKKDANGKEYYEPDPNLYQKVDHLMHTDNIKVTNLEVVITNNAIDGKIIPYIRTPALPKAGSPLRPLISWKPNFLVEKDGWPSDHTLNIYDIKLSKEAKLSNGTFHKRYRVNYN